MALSCGFYQIVIFVHGALCHFYPSMPDLGKVKPDYYEINVDNLNDLWHNAIIRGLIKVRANELLAYVPRVENVVYKQCERDAKSIVALAKCAVRVFDSRDYMEMKAAETKKKKAKPIVTIVAQQKSNHTWIYGSTKESDKHLTEKTNQSTRHFVANSTIMDPVMRQTSKKRLKLKKLAKSKPIKAFVSSKLSLLSQSGVSRKPVRLFKVVDGKRRRKRSIFSGTDPKSSGSSLNLREVVKGYVRKILGKSSDSSNMENLRLLYKHFKNTEKINTYFKQMNSENRRLYEQIALPIDSRTPEITNEAVSVVEQVLQIVNSFVAHQSSKFSILSPRLLSLFPEPSSGNRLLSPTFFSFQKDGYLSLPELFDIISSDQKQQQFLLDIVMDASGAGAVLKDLITRMKPEMDELRYVKLPLFEELSRKDREWIRMRNSFTEEQARDYNQKGYAFLNEDQLNLIYTKQDQLLSGINVTKLGMMSKEEKAKRVESDIRQLASLDRPKWPMWENVRSIRKREANEVEEEHRINGVLYETLHPYAFTPSIAKGAALEVVTLSPHAFIPEIIRPQALVLETLSPRAFIAAVLSPSALVARILSPTSFRAEVLSPRALHTWILSPEALIAEVLSPQFIDPRVLSPEALIIDVLSPDFLSPRILSPEGGGVIILSPNILSPRVASEEKLLVEVLSPHILGGSHSREEATREVVQIGSRSDSRSNERATHSIIS